jgi:CubicO group peptidase (beta-lactamase class C family)
MRAILVAASLVALPAPAASSPALDALASRLPRIESIVEEQRVKLHIPGAAFAIVMDDQVVYLKAFGVRDVERNLPATVDTLFPIGSCTKSFTSMAAAVSQDEGVLTLDDSPKRLMPWFKLSDPEADALVTVRDMLSHRTGLRAYADLAAEPAVLTREEYVRAAMLAKPAAKLRAKFQYSNAMYTAVGEILGRAHHTTWERVIADKIFTPLGMNASFASVFDAKAADRATGYVYQEDTKTWRVYPPPESLRTLAPAGSIASTARDLTRWLRFLIGGGKLDGRTIVSEATFRDVIAPHIPVNAAFSYALGWAVYDWNGHKVVEHNGGSRGISALVSFMPDRRVGFVFLGNTSPTFMTGIGNAGKLLWPLIVGEEAAAPSPPPSPEPAPAAAEAKDLPSADELVARMVRASGGERNLRRHQSMVIHAGKSYDNQGVRGDVTIRARSPSLRAEDEILSALGKRIGRVRTFCDGVAGGQETTFGQNETYAGPELDRARREAAWHPLLDVKRLYKQAAVTRRQTIGDEDTYVLELTPDAGKPVLYYVSARTALPQRREADGETTSYSDYRNVDGEVVPFRLAVTDALGESTVLVKDVRFDVAIPAAAFSPAAR